MLTQPRSSDRLWLAHTILVGCSLLQTGRMGHAGTSCINCGWGGRSLQPCALAQSHCALSTTPWKPLSKPPLPLPPPRPRAFIVACACLHMAECLTQLDAVQSRIFVYHLADSCIAEFRHHNTAIHFACQIAALCIFVVTDPW